KVTREHGVALYIHYSGVWDSVAVRQHPEWARIGPNFLPDKDMTSTYGSYVDDLLIPQLKELVDTYDLDGVWVDGECWAVRPDFSPAARAAFQQATGRTAVPEKAGAPGWPDLLASQRQQFESYVTHYVEALYTHAPAFQLTSNWMHSARMPLPVRAPLDFLSGDYTPGEAVNSARLEGRRFAAVREAQRINWDLMAWGFNFDPQARGERSLKPAIQLMQEASILLGQGGGYQIYFKPTRAGWIDEPTVDVAAEVGAFCRERQAVSHGAETVPQVALLLSETAHFDLLDQQGALYSPRPLKPLEGVLHALLELHYSVDVLTEEQLLGEQGRIAEYPVTVVPEWHVLGTGIVDRLVEYVRRGGRLLVIGAATAGLFKDYLSVRFDGEAGDLSAKSVQASLSGKRPMLAWTGTPWQAVALAGDSEQVRTVGRRFEQFNLRDEGEIASTLTRAGGGAIGAIYGPLGSAHYQYHHPATRTFVGEMMAMLFPEPVVEIDGPSSIDVSVRRKDD
ncbi:MAG TPA: hypothetical protein VGW38_24850, partial [Chloroflexota bacterium]|nr:hypothetical protein [Chloroflexota bacterium]